MKAIVIGASTGGPQAVEAILSGFTPDLDAVVIVLQHLPLKFTKSMVSRLASIIRIPIFHAEIGATLRLFSLLLIWVLLL